MFEGLLLLSFFLSFVFFFLSFCFCFCFVSVLGLMLYCSATACKRSLLKHTNASVQSLCHGYRYAMACPIQYEGKPSVGGRQATAVWVIVTDWCIMGISGVGKYQEHS